MSRTIMSMISNHFVPTHLKSVSANRLGYRLSTQKNGTVPGLPAG